MARPLRTVLATDHRHEEAFLELYAGEEQWGEIYEDTKTEQLMLLVFPPTTGDRYSIFVSDLHELLHEAAAKMRRRE